MKQRGNSTILVIILGFFIAFVLIGYFKNNKVSLGFNNVFTNQNTKNISPKSNLVTSYTNCGIEIDSPKIFDTVENVFEFSGRINGCGWTNQGGYMGVLEVIADNVPVTEKINIPVNADNTFKVMIALKQKPGVDNGLILLQSVSSYQTATFGVYFK